MKTYEEIYQAVTNENERATYPEAIDGGYGYRPVSGYRVYKRDYPSVTYEAFYESVFSCYDGWDSMMDDEPTYIGESKREAILGCYIQMQENTIFELEQEIKKLKELSKMDEAVIKALRNKFDSLGGKL